MEIDVDRFSRHANSLLALHCPCASTGGRFGVGARNLQLPPPRSNQPLPHNSQPFGVASDFFFRITLMVINISLMTMSRNGLVF